jgi:hypothetical protein
MAQEYKVSKAFQGKDKETNQPEVVNTKAGPCHKYLFQVDEQIGWFNTLRKINPDGKSNPLKEGDTVYGDFAENNYGKLAFVKAQRPFQAGAQTTAPQYSGTVPQKSAAASADPTTELEAKVDYVISLLENFLSVEDAKKQPGDTKPVANDDDAPLNLDDIDY